MAATHRVTRFTAIGLLLLFAYPACAQVQVGDVNMNMNGTVSTGYSAVYGNEIGSSHTLGFGGTGTLSGSYYDPGFLTFNFAPYYNQSRANSNFQSITDSSGFNFNSGIFNGSHFPGSISYSKAYNSEGNFALPGLPNYTTHGNSDAFGINWSENVPGLPSLSAGFQRGGNQYSVYGTNDTGNTGYHSFTLHSGYVIDGFSLSAYYQNGTSHSQIPEVFSASQQTLTVNSNSDGYGFSASHALPLHGGISATFSRTNFGTEDQGYNYNGTVDLVSVTAGIQPTQKLHFSLSSNYSDNLTGSLYQALAPSGVIIPPVGQNEKSHSFDTQAVASYSILPNLQAQGNVERRDQYFLGESFGATTFGGGLVYTHRLFGGTFNGSTFVTDNRLDNSNLNTIGLTTTVNYNRQIELWVVSGSFSYAQNVQTLLVAYTTSYFNYSGHIRRRFGKFSWSAGAGASRTGFTALPGTDSHSESFNTGIGWRNWITASGGYSTASGIAIPTGTGLVTPPPPTPVPLPSLLILYGGHSYSFGLGSSPIRRLTIGASYSKASSNTTNAGIGSWNANKQLNAYFQYQFRKMYLNGGYATLSQGFSASSKPPATVSSYFVGVSRWFNFF
ncbi:MAG TPA: hypothetical protein VE263_15670 [Candidatus Angelobacter sp.]|nr:hypothetical protein [Candidatus Angelobacter sp.]